MKKAFTLIELLVVIAIIAILAAILFPVFAQAKAAAKKTQCVSNMKNLGTAFVMYAGDYDDVMPTPGGLGGVTAAWDYIDNNGASPVLDPYLKNRGTSTSQVFVCPNLTSVSVGPWSTSRTYLKYPRSYGMNQYLRAAGSTLESSPVSVSDVDAYNPALVNKGYQTLNKLPGGISSTAINYPAATVLLYEGIAENTGDNFQGYVGRAGDWTSVGGFFPDAATCKAGIGFACQITGIKAWHTEKDNYLYTDSHVKSRTPEKQGYIPSLAQPSEFLLSHCRDAGSTCP